jgi:oxygen-dependent protoporphyrinogen oxidase
MPAVTEPGAGADSDRLRKRVVIVGAGIAGLAAAWELTGGAEPRADAPEVVVLERSDRAGGALRSEPFADRVVDMGADGFLGRRPEAVDLCRELGLDTALVPVAARGASVWARGRLRPLPEGLALGVPTRFWPTARSGIVGLRGDLALARDALLPRPDSRGPMGDRSIGPLVTRKLGRRVVDRLVDPMIGGIHAGSVDDMSAAATFPPLLAAAQRKGSLMRALRAEVPAPDPDGPPLFWALDGGMALLVRTLVDALTARGVDLRLSSDATGLDRAVAGQGWTLSTASGACGADAVILAAPAGVVAGLLRPHDDEAAALLDAVDYASVMLVTLRVSADDIGRELTGTGFLVPRHGSSRLQGDDALAVTACTYLDRKWPHLAREGELLLRASLGRKDDARPAQWDDDTAVDRTWSELTGMLGLSGAPRDAVVARCPDALPQYRVHHPLRTAGVEAAVARLGGVAVAGAAYHGVGIPACIASGRAAAHAVS